jgi:hypothetical protein
MCSEAPPDLWPLRPQPFAEEAFSGWLARISQAHGLPPWRFVRELRRCVRTRAHDLDVHPSYELIAEVSRRTGVNYNRIVQMTLRGHVESWVGRKAMSQEPEDAFGFCPSCWAADTEPYIRRAWRLPWTACALHRIALCRQCPACHWISSWSHLAAVGGLAVCGGCGADLRQLLRPGGRNGRRSRWRSTSPGKQSNFAVVISNGCSRPAWVRRSKARSCQPHFRGTDCRPGYSGARW